jgi:hypothetical protein
MLLLAQSTHKALRTPTFAKGIRRTVEHVQNASGMLRARNL